MEFVATARLLPPPMNAISAIVGVLGLVFLHVAVDIGGVAATYGPIGHGGSEWMIVYHVLLWFIAHGGHLMAPQTQKSFRKHILYATYPSLDNR